MNKIDTLRIATRESPLALAQSHLVREQLLQLHPQLQIELVPMKTTGDKFLNMSLAKIGGKGLFVKELEQALLDNQADIAVHSMKDLPMSIPGAFTLAAICEREGVHDVCVSKTGLSIANLPPQATVGTSSLRRICQLRAKRADLSIQLLRGNVNSRLNRLDQGEYDAIVLAYAGLQRLGFSNRISEHFNPEEFLPAVGQGALGIECRKEDQQIIELLKPLNHTPTSLSVQAERAMATLLGGSCQVPIAGYAQINAPDQLTLTGLVGDPSGTPIYRAQASGPAQDWQQMGQKVAKDLLAQGAQQILDEINNH